MTHSGGTYVVTPYFSWLDVDSVTWIKAHGHVCSFPCPSFTPQSWRTDICFFSHWFRHFSKLKSEHPPPPTLEHSECGAFLNFFSKNQWKQISEASFPSVCPQPDFRALGRDAHWPPGLLLPAPDRLAFPPPGPFLVSFSQWKILLMIYDRVLCLCSPISSSQY